MRSIILIILVLCGLSAKAQEGFVQACDIDEGGMAFHNMLLNEDTIVIIGGKQNLDYPQWGVFFCKMDTLGNILDYKVHYDTLGDTYVFGQNYEMIKTSDGGYALVGELFGLNYPIIIKLDVNGNLEFVREYPDDTVLNQRHWNIVEFEHGYISTGVKQQADDGFWDAFIMRTDHEGNKVWEISYGESGVMDSFRGLKKMSENEFWLLGGTSIKSNSVPSLYDVWKMNKIYRIDTMGIMGNVWEGEQEYIDNSTGSPVHIYSDGNGNWVHEGSYVDVLSDEIRVQQPEVLKRDEDFNVMWSTRFGLPTSNRNNFQDLVHTPDGGWVAAGQYWEEVPQSIPPVALQSGWLAKVSAEGDSLWSRTDTVYNNANGAEVLHYLSGVVALPSGSIIACGHLNRYQPEPAKSMGWIVKVDKDGCIEPGCNPILDAVNFTPLFEKIEVYPNPTSDVIQISSFDRYDWKLADNNGRLVKRGSSLTENSRIDLTDLPTGIYFLQLKMGNRILTKKIVKI